MYQELKNDQLKSEERFKEQNEKFDKLQQEMNQKFDNMMAMFQQMMTGLSATQQTINSNNTKENEKLKLEIAQKANRNSKIRKRSKK